MITEMKIHKAIKFTSARGRHRVPKLPGAKLVVKTDTLPSDLFFDLPSALWQEVKDAQVLQQVRGNSDPGPMVRMISFRPQKWFSANLIGLPGNEMLDVFGDYRLVDDDIQIRATDGRYGTAWWLNTQGVLNFSSSFGDFEKHRMEIERFNDHILDVCEELRPMLTSSTFYWQCKQVRTEPLYLQAKEEADAWSKQMFEIDLALQGGTLIEIAKD